MLAEVDLFFPNKNEVRLITGEDDFAAALDSQSQQVATLAEAKLALRKTRE